MEGTLRKSGIDVIGDIPWGKHFCVFYQTKDDLREILVPYFKAGLENNEFCMWVTSEPLPVEEAKRSLRESVKNLDEYIENGQIEILDCRQWYTKSGIFDAGEVLRGWVDKEEQALGRGFAGLRLSGNTFWLEKEDWRAFADYEATVCRVMDNYRMIGACTYSLDRCRAAEVIDVVYRHQFALIRREGKWELIESAERRWAEEALRLSEENFRALAENATDGILVSVGEGSHVYGNRQAAEITGYSVAELLKTTIKDLAHPDEFEKLMQIYRRRIEGKPVPSRYETVIVRKDGKGVPIEVAGAKTVWQGKTADMVFFRDITQRKQVEENLRSSTEQLRALAAHLQSVREEERTRIAREIHDELGQALTGLKMDLVWMASKLPAGQTHLLEKAKSMSELAAASVESVRRLSTELRPGVLDDLGLGAAIEWQTQEFQRRTGIHCQAAVPLVNPKLSRAAVTAIFRILQELLTNVARHATATRVTVKMKVTTSKLILEVHDNGRGIPDSAISSPQSLGLLGIRERALLLGGEVQIRGIAHKGTSVTVTIPVHDEENSRTDKDG